MNFDELWLRSLSFDRGNFWDISSTSIDNDLQGAAEPEDRYVSLSE